MDFLHKFRRKKTKSDSRAGNAKTPPAMAPQVKRRWNPLSMLASGCGCVTPQVRGDRETVFKEQAELETVTELASEFAELNSSPAHIGSHASTTWLAEPAIVPVLAKQQPLAEATQVHSSADADLFVILDPFLASTAHSDVSLLQSPLQITTMLSAPALSASSVTDGADNNAFKVPCLHSPPCAPSSSSALPTNGTPHALTHPNSNGSLALLPYDRSLHVLRKAVNSGKVKVMSPAPGSRNTRALDILATLAAGFNLPFPTNPFTFVIEDTSQLDMLAAISSAVTSTPRSMTTVSIAACSNSLGLHLLANIAEDLATPTPAARTASTGKSSPLGSHADLVYDSCTPVTYNCGQQFSNSPVALQLLAETASDCASPLSFKPDSTAEVALSDNPAALCLLAETASEYGSCLPPQAKPLSRHSTAAMNRLVAAACGRMSPIQLRRLSFTNSRPTGLELLATVACDLTSPSPSRALALPISSSIGLDLLSMVACNRGQSLARETTAPAAHSDLALDVLAHVALGSTPEADLQPLTRTPYSAVALNTLDASSSLMLKPSSPASRSTFAFSTLAAVAEDFTSPLHAKPLLASTVEVRSELGDDTASGSASPLTVKVLADADPATPCTHKHEARAQMPQDLRQAYVHMSKGVATEIYQDCWANWRAGQYLGKHDKVLTFMSIAPTASPKDMSRTAVIRMVNRLAEGKVDMAANMVAKEALMLHTCAHRGVVSLKFVGLTPPAMPDDTPDPCCVEYFGTPIADLSLDKLLGRSAYGKASLPLPVGPSISLKEIAGYGKQILQAVEHIHKCGVLHMHLVPQHVLLFSRRRHRHRSASHTFLRARLTGFNHAEKLDALNQDRSVDPYRGCSQIYTPPEASSTCLLTTAADVFQFGGLVQFMLLGEDHTGGELPACIPEDWRNLVQCCQAANVQDRPTIPELLAMLSLLQHTPAYDLSAPSATLIRPAVHTLDAAAIASSRPASAGAGYSLSSFSFIDKELSHDKATIHSLGNFNTPVDKPEALTFELHCTGNIQMAQPLPSDGMWGKNLSSIDSPDHEIDPAEPAQLIPSRGAAGCSYLSSAQEELAPLLTPAATPMPRLLLGADAWLPDASTVCQVEELTPGSCVAELNLQSTAGNAASLQAAGSDSNPDPGHITNYSMTMHAPVRSQRRPSLHRWDSDAVQAAAQWLSSSGLPQISKLTDSPKVQDAQDFLTDVWEHWSAKFATSKTTIRTGMLQQI